MGKRLVVVGRLGPAVQASPTCAGHRTGEIKIDNSIIQTGRQAAKKGA